MLLCFYIRKSHVPRCSSTTVWLGVWWGLASRWHIMSAQNSLNLIASVHWQPPGFLSYQTDKHYKHPLFVFCFHRHFVAELSIFVKSHRRSKLTGTVTELCIIFLGNKCSSFKKLKIGRTKIMIIVWGGWFFLVEGGLDRIIILLLHMQ